jgi:anti-sigma regulatory factor (Ser/Thr protein kinase)
MMTEISLNILDIAQNSVRAEASLVEIHLSADTGKDDLTVIIKDNGCGMSEEQLAKVADPFFTTRDTRGVGLGVSFFQYAAEQTGGSFSISSELGKGTEVAAVFKLSSVDRMPLGDITETIRSLIVHNGGIDFLYTYSVDGRSLKLDTKEFKKVLGEDVSFSEPDVSAYIRDYLTENKAETDAGTVI